MLILLAILGLVLADILILIGLLIVVWQLKNLTIRMDHLATRLRFLESREGIEYKEEDGSDTWTANPKSLL